MVTHFVLWKIMSQEKQQRDIGHFIDQMEEEVIDFTSHEKMTEQSFKYIIALNNPAKLVGPWNNKSLEEFYNKNF